MCLGLQPKVAQRKRNLNTQLSEGKGTLTHTVSDCELAQGCTLTEQGFELKTAHSEQGFESNGAQLCPSEHIGLLLTAHLFILSPMCRPYQCQYIVTPSPTTEVCLTFKLFKKWRSDSLTDDNNRELIYKQLWPHSCDFTRHVYMWGTTEWKWHVELCSIFYITLALEGHCAVDVSNLSW